ncbi:hypothetical protein NQ314_008976 [Rhamnusium bicolor]|uniref:Uncharacterized protein n=1 Tax=Rhamnusium bicolor TaxID=1586634 RepID=A0AAV8Y3W2_9CUCU|nr:hypothetical protein NQ314_008976 [Rhamnusium bicolor]
MKISKTVSRENECENEPKNLTLQLAEWATKHKITHVALNDILSILKPYNQFLPTDSRTLLKTPRKVNVRDIYPGQYCHFGLYNCVLKLLSLQNLENMEVVIVFINIDGLPISKSSGSQFYPILCSICESTRVIDIIGIYHGKDKPKMANDFLQEFVDEAIELTNNGHSGYNSCSKCCIEGSYVNNRVYFPNLHPDRLRNDNNFRCKLQEDHHLGTSVLETIPNLNMVDDFPLDPMHLLYLGMSYNQISQISNSLVNQADNIPCEFNRKGHWKKVNVGKQQRQFLLYTGPVVLKSVLDDDKYLNFLTLPVAISILSSSKYKQQIDYADSLLNYFVKTFIILYDVKRFGPLDQFSAFPFENYMQSLKKLLRKSDKPLAQIICRKTEFDNYYLNLKNNSDYAVARSKTRKAECTSDLNSDSDVKKISKRKIRKKEVSSSEISDSSDEDGAVALSRLPIPPQLCKGI